MLSSYTQFRKSRFGKKVSGDLPPDERHPKLAAAMELVARIVRDEVRRAPEQGWIGKVLVFATYVGAEIGCEIPKGESAHGTPALLKQRLERRLRQMPSLRRATRKEGHRVSAVLQRAVVTQGRSLEETEKRQPMHRIRRFAGTPAARLLLTTPENLVREASELRALLRALEPTSERAEHSVVSEELQLRLKERRRRLFDGILGRYATRDLVARYDGATSEEDRERHLRGFNSPFAPLVLVASSVAQEGIDLQRHCRHVVHYDLEWNPAKLEQREGRVDRQGREAAGPVNVYFLVCRDTYDERVLHVMANRFRWHHVLLARKRMLAADPGLSTEAATTPRLVGRLEIDLRPPT